MNIMRQFQPNSYSGTTLQPYTRYPSSGSQKTLAQKHKHQKVVLDQMEYFK